LTAVLYYICAAWAYTQHLTKTLKKDTSIDTKTEQLKLVASPGPQLQLLPNPFCTKTTVVLNQIFNSLTNISIYSLDGRLIKVAFIGFLKKGIYQYELNGSFLPSGCYIVRCRSNNQILMAKLILLK